MFYIENAIGDRDAVIASHSPLCRNPAGAALPESDSFPLGQKRGRKRFPFGIETGPLESASGPPVPIIGIAHVSLFAVQVGVNRHAVKRVEFVHQSVGAYQSPFASHHSATSGGARSPGTAPCFTEARNCSTSMSPCITASRTEQRLGELTE